MASWATRPVEIVQNHHSDSRVWAQLDWRPDDIIVSTYAKSGTTLCQQLIGQILSGADPEYNQQASSPWLDMRILPPGTMDQVKTMPSPRMLKTHLPSTALPYHPEARYVYIARDGRDVLWSMHNHFTNLKPETYEMLNGPGLVGEPLPPPPADVLAYFREWLDRDGWPLWPFFSHVKSWWEVRDLPNVLLVHFNNLRHNISHEGRRIAKFLNVQVPEDQWHAIEHHCSMDFMRANAEKTVPMGGGLWKHGAADFVFKGTNGRWKHELTPEDSQKYEELAAKELGPECAAWLATGKMTSH